MWKKGNNKFKELGFLLYTVFKTSIIYNNNILKYQRCTYYLIISAHLKTLKMFNNINLVTRVLPLVYTLFQMRSVKTAVIINNNKNNK